MLTRLAKLDLRKQIYVLYFLRDFIKDPVGVGAISGSSEALARAMVDSLQIAPGDPVIELGPGTGAFTEQIRMKTNVYLGIERSPRFTRILYKRFPDLRFVNGLAEDGFEHYSLMGLPPPKAIVSGLPLAIWSPELQDSVIAALDSLMTPGCTFRTFQYAHSFAFPLAIRFRREMNARFGPFQRSRIVLRNLPPAFILTWSRDQD